MWRNDTIVVALKRRDSTTRNGLKPAGAEACRYI
jgi:hypothetical protein